MEALLLSHLKRLSSLINTAVASSTPGTFDHQVGAMGPMLPRVLNDALAKYNEIVMGTVRCLWLQETGIDW